MPSCTQSRATCNSQEVGCPQKSARHTPGLDSVHSRPVAPSTLFGGIMLALDFGGPRTSTARWFAPWCA
eukprot:gene19934-biopygen14596